MSAFKNELFLLSPEMFLSCHVVLLCTVWPLLCILQFSWCIIEHSFCKTPWKVRKSTNDAWFRVFARQRSWYFSYFPRIIVSRKNSMNRAYWAFITIWGCISNGGSKSFFLKSEYWKWHCQDTGDIIQNVLFYLQGLLKFSLQIRPSIYQERK